MNEKMNSGGINSQYEYACVKSKFKKVFLNYGWELVQEISGICQLRREVKTL